MNPRRALVLLGLTLAVGSPIASAAPAPLTFTKDIAPLIWARCGSCHRPDSLAPFSLLEYPDVVSRARQIVAVTKNHTMPPWLPEPGHGEFEGARRLTDTETRQIEEWVRDGTPRGNVADLPPRPVWNDGWQLGAPDLVVEAPGAYLLQPGSRDVFRNLVIPISIPASRYVRGIDVDPGNRRVVHHASIAIDRSRASRQLDMADPEPGYPGGMFPETARSPESRAIGWTPGITPAFEPPGMAWRLDPGSDLVLLLHLLPPREGEPAVVRPRIAFYFATAPPSRLPIDFKLGSKAIDIPAGASAYAIEDRYTLPADVDLLSIDPHAHYLAREMKASATLPDGTVTDLLWIRNWDFHWQDQYRYRDPVALPRGTVVTMRYTYDNSVANKHNPASAPTRVVYGPQSSDEMGDLWLRLLPRTLADGAVLARAYTENELRKDLLLRQQMVASYPREAKWRNALGASYLDAGRVPEAIGELQEALRLMANSAEAHNNLGHALQLQDRLPDAIGHFREAERLAPANDLVHLNLANALQETGDLAEAIAEFTRAIELNPAGADAHNNVGVALGSLGRIDEAIAHFEAAIELRPDYADARNNLTLAQALRARPKS